MNRKKKSGKKEVNEVFPTNKIEKKNINNYGILKFIIFEHLAVLVTNSARKKIPELNSSFKWVKQLHKGTKKKKDTGNL